MEEVSNNRRLCPAEINPLAELALQTREAISSDSLIFCYCEAGPQPGRRMLFGVELPIEDRRPGKWICGKTLDEIND